MFFELSCPHMMAFSVDALFMLPKAAIVVNLLPNDSRHSSTVTFFSVWNRKCSLQRYSKIKCWLILSPKKNYLQNSRFSPIYCFFHVVDTLYHQQSQEFFGFFEHVRKRKFKKLCKFKMEKKVSPIWECNAAAAAKQSNSNL